MERTILGGRYNRRRDYLGLHDVQGVAASNTLKRLIMKIVNALKDAKSIPENINVEVMLSIGCNIVSDTFILY